MRFAPNLGDVARVRPEAAPSLAAFRAARAATLPLLERMMDGDWQRAGTQSERGRYTAEY